MMASDRHSPSRSSNPRSIDSFFRFGAFISRNCVGLTCLFATIGLGLNSISLDSSPLDSIFVRDPPFMTLESIACCICSSLACLNPRLSLPNSSSRDSFASTTGFSLLADLFFGPRRASSGDRLRVEIF